MFSSVPPVLKRAQAAAAQEETRKSNREQKIKPKKYDRTPLKLVFSVVFAMGEKLCKNNGGKKKKVEVKTTTENAFAIRMLNLSLR